MALKWLKSRQIRYTHTGKKKSAIHFHRRCKYFYTVYLRDCTNNRQIVKFDLLFEIQIDSIDSWLLSIKNDWWEISLACIECTVYTYISALSRLNRMCILRQGDINCIGKWQKWIRGGSHTHTHVKSIQIGKCSPFGGQTIGKHRFNSV